jgi:hypothetical protein
MSNQLDAPKYYTPYESGEDTDYDTDEEYDDKSLPNSEDARIRREEDPRYALIRASGPNFNTPQQQLKYTDNLPGSAYDNTTDISSLNNLVYLNPPKTTQTSLFSIKSSNRDKRVYPSPFNYQIKLPRIYKNVTKFQLVQLSFPNNTAFLASPQNLYSTISTALDGLVPSSCISTCIGAVPTTDGLTSIGLVEKDRLNTEGHSFITSLGVKSGLYTNEELANELNRQSNNTPPFTTISYNNFKDTFQHTRNISVLFNEPGDYFHSNLTHTQYTYHTKETIMNAYYTYTHIDTHPIITDKIALNAYYYPVLKEFVATRLAKPFTVLPIGYTYEQIYNSTLNMFLGLDSDLYYEVCSTNRSTLDIYRKYHTFETRNINKYVWSYNDDTKRFSCIHNTLHTSIRNDITSKYSTFLSQHLSYNNLTQNTFTTLKNNYSIYNAVFKDLEYNLSTILSTTSSIVNYSYNGGDFHSTIHYSTLNSSPSIVSSVSTTKIYGQKYGTHTGISITTTDFLEYHSTISSFHSLKEIAYSTISSINGNANNNHHSYISTHYNGVFPSHIISTRSYNTYQSIPVRFIGNKLSYTPGESLADSIDPSTCTALCKQVLDPIILGFYSCIPVNGIINSLAYRLGLINLTDYNITSTIAQFNASLNRPIDFLLQINSDRSFNNMDIAMDENYSITNETTGQVKLVSAKILSAGVGAGELTQTVIQNPVLFENPLGKLDKLEFKLYFDDNTLTPMSAWLPIPFDIYEWNATFQIDEEIGFANRDTGWGNTPTVPIPNNPNLLQFMALTTKDNPNNK